jgi:Tfp pilus assembly protein PilN
VAAAAAWSARDETVVPPSFDLPAPSAATARRIWMRRTGKLTRYGVPVLGGLALIAALLGGAALGLRWTVQAKARAWSGDLRRWDEFQRRKAAVEAELRGVQGLLGRRTALYSDLQGISGRVPPETWLETWEAECKVGSRCSHRLEGYAFSEARVPEFLATLEKSGTAGRFVLKATEKIKGEAVERKTGIAANRRDLVRFQLGSAP